MGQDQTFLSMESFRSLPLPNIQAALVNAVVLGPYVGSADVFEEFYRIAELFAKSAAILGFTDTDHRAGSDCGACFTYGAVHAKLEAYSLAHAIFWGFPAIFVIFSLQ